MEKVVPRETHDALDWIQSFHDRQSHEHPLSIEKQPAATVALLSVLAKFSVDHSSDFLIGAVHGYTSLGRDALCLDDIFDFEVEHGCKNQRLILPNAESGLFHQDPYATRRRCD